MSVVLCAAVVILVGWRGDFERHEQGISLEDELNARTDVSRDRQENVMRLVQQVEERRERAEDGEV